LKKEKRGVPPSSSPPIIATNQYPYHASQQPERAQLLAAVAQHAARRLEVAPLVLEVDLSRCGGCCLGLLGGILVGWV
jgi:hypothetical protein